MQVGRQGTIGHKQARETLAQMSEWMLNRGFLFPRNAAPAAKAYSAGQLRLTWLDAGWNLMLFFPATALLPWSTCYCCKHYVIVLLVGELVSRHIVL